MYIAISEHSKSYCKILIAYASNVLYFRKKNVVFLLYNYKYLVVY